MSQVNSGRTVDVILKQNEILRDIAQAVNRIAHALENHDESEDYFTKS